MMKFLVVFALLAVGSQAKTLQLINGRNVGIQVTAGSEEVSLVANGAIVLTVEDGWSGTISAVPELAEVTTGPRTKAELTIGTLSDSYDVSLKDGFNLGLKVIPVGSSNCSAAVCASGILRVCPVANQVANAIGTVVGCQNSPVIMGALCPLAVVDDVTAVTNVKTCTDATGYLVLVQ